MNVYASQGKKIDAQKALELAQLQAHYYGYNEIDEAFNNAKLFLSTNPRATLNIVGHSLGGWQAAHLAKQINKVRCGALDNLITLDPVDTKYRFKKPSGIKFSTPKADTKMWINIRAERLGILTDFDNWVANTGGQWDPGKNELPPHYNFTLEAGHGEAMTMLKSEVQNSKGNGTGFSSRDILVKHYINLPITYNYENAPKGKR